MPENVSKFIVENAGADLEHQMGTALTPAHLLFFHHPLAHHLVDGRFYKGGGDSLSLAPPLPIIRNEPGVGPDVGLP